MPTPIPSIVPSLLIVFRYDDRSMRRAVLVWVSLNASLIGLGLALFLRKSESDRIREGLDSIVSSLRLQSGPPQPSWVATLRNHSTIWVSDPVLLRMEPQGESRVSLDALFGRYFELARGYRSIDIRISNIGVKIDAHALRATAKGEAYVDLLTVSNERRGEPRKFACTLEKSQEGWRIVHVEISEPRIDQPEARP